MKQIGEQKQTFSHFIRLTGCAKSFVANSTGAVKGNYKLMTGAPCICTKRYIFCSLLIHSDKSLLVFIMKIIMFTLLINFV